MNPTTSLRRTNDPRRIIFFEGAFVFVSAFFGCARLEAVLFVAALFTAELFDTARCSGCLPVILPVILDLFIGDCPDRGASKFGSGGCFE